MKDTFQEILMAPEAAEDQERRRIWKELKERLKLDELEPIEIESTPLGTKLKEEDE